MVAHIAAGRHARGPVRSCRALLGVNTFRGQLANATLVLLATQTLHVGVRAYDVLGGLVNARIVARSALCRPC